MYVMQSVMMDNLNNLINDNLNTNPNPNPNLT